MLPCGRSTTKPITPSFSPASRRFSAVSGRREDATAWCFSLEAKDLLMVDDMPHGGVMARAVGVDFACAGWYGMLPDIEEKMRRQCDFFFSSVEEFSAFLFGDENAIAE